MLAKVFQMKIELATGNLFLWTLVWAQDWVLWTFWEVLNLNCLVNSAVLATELALILTFGTTTEEMVTERLLGIFATAFVGTRDCHKHASSLVLSHVQVLGQILQFTEPHAADRDVDAANVEIVDGLLDCSVSGGI